MARILWIDDEIATTVQYAVAALKQYGHDITAATSIKSSLEILRLLSDSKSGPDLIILDCIMTIKPEDVAELQTLTKLEPYELDNSRRVGLVLMGRIATLLPSVPVIVLTNLTASTPIGQEVLDGIRKYSQVKEILPKPQRVEKLDEYVRKYAL